jgi:hypothetical protein
MNHSELILLMHAVLDGEAGPEETLELRRVLADSPTARAQFEELRRLFDALRSVPRACPPEGLVASVLARIPRPGTHEPLRKLFIRSGVIGRASDARGAIPGRKTMAQRTFPPRSYLGGDNMSEQKRSSFGRRGVWIGLGVTAIVIALVVQFGLDFPPGNKDVTGTIVPAQRYRADQPTAADVKLGGQEAAPAGVSSPGGNLAGQAGAAQTGAQTGVQTGAQTGMQTGMQTGVQTGVQTGAQTGVQTGAQTGAQTGVQTGAQTGVQTGAQTGVQTGAQTGAQTGIQTGVQQGVQTGVTR